MLSLRKYFSMLTLMRTNRYCDAGSSLFDTRVTINRNNTSKKLPNDDGHIPYLTLNMLIVSIQDSSCY
jgi:hypothetical protein